MNTHSPKRADPKDHLSNERTFLSWVRTSVGLMAFGFVIERFAVFIKQITAFEEKTSIHPHSSSFVYGYSSILGLLLIAFGTFICFLAYIKYKKVEKQLEDDSYRSASPLNGILAFSMLLMGISLTIYLIYSI